MDTDCGVIGVTGARRLLQLLRPARPKCEETDHFIGDDLSSLIARLKADPLRWYADNRLPLPASKEVPMMWGMGLIWLLIIVLLALGVAALVKYLFFNRRR